MRSLLLLDELHRQGVMLWADSRGRLGYRAPHGVMNSALLKRMQAEKVQLLDAVSGIHLEPMLGVKCPWCEMASRLLEYADGLWCSSCGEAAWRFGREGSIVRCDWIE